MSYFVQGQDEAVSEVTGTLMLVTMAIVMFSALSLIILNPWTNFFDESPPLVTLVGYINTVDGNNRNIIIEHRGGVSLSKDTQITVTINGNENSFIASEKLIDSNNDGEWSIGERVSYPHSGPKPLLGFTFKCIVVDVTSNTVVMDKVILEL